MTLEELIARESIRETLASYNIFGDAARAEDITNCFAEECELELINGSIFGKQAVGEFYQERRAVREEDHRNGRPARHFLSTHKVEITGPTTGNSVTYFLFVRLGMIEQMGTYHDRFEKSRDRWLITYRKVEMNWMMPEDRPAGRV